MYEESHVNVKDEPRSTLSFRRNLSYIASILFTYVNFTRKWKSALNDRNLQSGSSSCKRNQGIQWWKKYYILTAYDFTWVNLLPVKKSRQLFYVDSSLCHLVRITVVVLRRIAFYKINSNKQ